LQMVRHRLNIYAR